MSRGFEACSYNIVCGRKATYGGFENKSVLLCPLFNFFSLCFFVVFCCHTIFLSPYSFD